MASIILTVGGLKLFRNAFTIPSTQYLVYLFSFLYVHFDNHRLVPYLFIAYFISGILFVKVGFLILN